MPSQRTVLITGGTRGIGEAIARHLAEREWQVVVGSHDSQELAQFRPQTGIQVVKLDVTSAEDIASVMQNLPNLAGLVNCAGILQRGGVEFTIDGFRRTIEVNLIGTMQVCLQAYPALVRGQGAVVNTASMLSFFGSPFVPGYSASKGGVAQLTKSLAAAWGKNGVRVNAIAPGWIQSEMTRPLVDDADRSAALMARTPLGRWGEPRDLAGVVEFLLSEQARFITGAILPVDGGYLTV